jgi:hypothetical protein
VSWRCAGRTGGRPLKRSAADPEIQFISFTELQFTLVVEISTVADPDPGSGAFLTPGSGIPDSGWVKNQDPGPARTIGSSDFPRSLCFI